MKINTFIIMSLVTAASATTRTHSSLRRSVESDTVIPTTAPTAMHTQSDYERICSTVVQPKLCEYSFRIAEQSTDCMGDEQAVGEWTADPECCNIGPEECERLGVESTCVYDEGDVDYWHCLFCCAES
jgi:hypothetical protein